MPVDAPRRSPGWRIGEPVRGRGKTLRRRLERRQWHEPPHTARAANELGGCWSPPLTSSSTARIRVVIRYCLAAQRNMEWRCSSWPKQNCLNAGRRVALQSCTVHLLFQSSSRLKRPALTRRPSINMPGWNTQVKVFASPRIAQFSLRNLIVLESSNHTYVFLSRSELAIPNSCWQACH